MALLGGTFLATGREALRGWRTLRRPRWGFKAQKMTSTLTPPTTPEAPTHDAFHLFKTETLDEYGATCHLYEHKKSKAQVLSVIKPDDDNKVFGVTFRTPPRDSTGLPSHLGTFGIVRLAAVPDQRTLRRTAQGLFTNFSQCLYVSRPRATRSPRRTWRTSRNLARVYLDVRSSTHAAKTYRPRTGGLALRTRGRQINVLRRRLQRDEREFISRLTR